MSLNIFLNKRLWTLAAISVAILIVASCNKDLPKATPIIYPPANNSTTSIGTLISTDTSFSFFKAAAIKVGVLASLSDSTKLFTVFLPNNKAFRASNSAFTSVAVINSLPIQTLGGIVNYAIIPGEQYTSTTIPTVFPNIQLPTAITIGKLPGTPVNLNLSTFPSVRSNGFWDNNIPVVMPDIKMQNGVIHLVAGIVAPPSQVLRDALYSNPNLTYFKAAIARADSGQEGLNKLDSLLNYPVTNMTVLAPDDAAFQNLLYATIYYALLAQGAPDYIAANQAAILSSSPDIFSNPSFYDALSATTVRGIIAYHFLATDQGAGFQPNIRVFSVNFSPTPSLVTTLVNSSYAPHPGILVAPTFTTLGPNISVVTDLKFTGLGTFPPGGAPFSGAPATAVSLDNHAVNGVYYVIDQVLLPK